jgi:hypothetical protein
MPADMPPIAEGSGRLVIDVADGPAPVGRLITESVVVALDKDRPITASMVTTEELCTAPCSVDIGPGRWQLVFPTRNDRQRVEIGEVDVAPATTTVYRRALGSYDGGGAGLVLGILGVVFGGASAITGVTLLPVGLAQDEDEGSGMALAGAITLGTGLILTAFGILGIALDPHIEQPGAAVQFELAPTTPPAAAPNPE